MKSTRYPPAGPGSTAVVLPPHARTSTAMESSVLPLLVATSDVGDAPFNGVTDHTRAPTQPRRRDEGETLESFLAGQGNVLRQSGGQ